MRAGGYPTPDIVPMDSYFIESGGRLLGDLFIRHRLSPQLEKFGGHVGYKVRPSERNRGVATTALGLALEKLAGMNVGHALLTCGETNAASARVIEKCGGIRIDNSETEYGIHRRYWVPTATAGPLDRS